MSSLMQKLIKGSTSKLTSNIRDSKVYGKKDMVPTDIPILNAALSGSLDGGISPGLLMIAGPSKHFKTAFGLVMASAYMNHYEDGALLFYDSEFGAPEGYFKSFGVDMDRVVHTPIMDVEELKFDILAQFKKNIEKDDHVFCMIDSVGNLASRKEVEDAENEKSVADMTRAKQLKSLGRIITPYLTLKEIPMVAINHTYKEISTHPRDIVGGGTGLYYSSNDVWIVGRQQDKEGKELQGYNFTINIDKSRYVREKSKFDVTVSFENGIEKWSGLFDLAVEAKMIVQSGAWYNLPGHEKSYRRSDIDTDTFWEEMVNNSEFKKFVERKYKFSEKEAQQEEDHVDARESEDLQ